MRPNKRILHKNFNPEKYKMALCPYCRGTGKSSDGGEGAKVCSQCGGFGWVKKEGDDQWITNRPSATLPFLPPPAPGNPAKKVEWSQWGQIFTLDFAGGGVDKKCWCHCNYFMARRDESILNLHVGYP
jgi:hypothetical protein